MKWGAAFGFAVAIFAAAALPAYAESLRVSPVSVELIGTETTSSVRVWTDSQEPMTVQARIFRWEQSEGQERLVPTDSVRVSPGIFQIKPGSENLVRIVRTSKSPVRGEETYRLLIDQVPVQQPAQRSMVRFVVRHSIPVFVTSDQASDGAVQFSIAPRKDGYTVRAHNSGQMRVRIVNLVATTGPRQIAAQSGLVGYALGGATMEWFVRAKPGGIGSGPVTISFESDRGPVSVEARAEGL